MFRYLNLLYYSESSLIVLELSPPSMEKTFILTIAESVLHLGLSDPVCLTCQGHSGPGLLVQL